MPFIVGAGMLGVGSAEPKARPADRFKGIITKKEFMQPAPRPDGAENLAV